MGWCKDRLVSFEAQMEVEMKVCCKCGSTNIELAFYEDDLGITLWWVCYNCENWEEEK